MPTLPLFAQLRRFTLAVLAAAETDADFARQKHKRADGDAGSVEQHKLPDQIAADKYLASKDAAKSKRRGLVFNKLVPPGAD